MGGDGTIEIKVHNAYFAPKRSAPCWKPKVPKGPDIPSMDGPDIPKPGMPDIDIPKPSMPDMPGAPSMPKMPKAPKCPCKRPPQEEKYTVTISTGGVMGVGATTYTSDELEDTGNYISFRCFTKDFDISEGESKSKGDKKIRIQIHKCGNSLNPLSKGKELADVTYEPDVSRLGCGEKVPLGKKFGKESYVYCSHYVRTRPS